MSLKLNPTTPPPDMWYSSGYDNPYGNVQLGNLTKKAGQEHQLSYLWGQNQRELGDASKRADSERGDLTSRYTGLAGGGMSPEEEQGIRLGTLTPLRGAFDVARSKASNRLARTRNSAGYGSLLSELGREEGRQSAQTGYDLEAGIGHEKFNRSLEGIKGLAQMYGVDTNLISELNSRAGAIQGAGSSIESRRKGKLGTIASGVNIASGVAGTLTGVNNLFKP